MTITINANVDDDGNRTIYIDGEECRSDLTLSSDWAQPLQAALDRVIRHRLTPIGEVPQTIELVFGEGQYSFQTGLRITGSHIHIFGISKDRTTILHDPRTYRDELLYVDFCAFLYQAVYSNDINDTFGLSELVDVQIQDLTVNFLDAGGNANGGVTFANCKNFLCRNVDIIGVEREEQYEDGELVGLGPYDPNDPMVGSHTNGIIVTRSSGRRGIISNCNVKGMSAPGIYLATAFDVDVIDCDVQGSVPLYVIDENGNIQEHGVSGFRVSNSEDITLVGCSARFNSGSGLQISHNPTMKVGSLRFPGRLVDIDRLGNTIRIEFDQPRGNTFPTIHEAIRLGVENPVTHRIEKLPLVRTEDVIVENSGDGSRLTTRSFTVTLPGDILRDHFPIGSDIDEIELHISFVPNRRITFDRCTANNNTIHGIEVGSEQHGSVGSDITFSGVRCLDNGANGMTISSAEYVQIKCCDCKGNENAGIYLLDTALTYHDRDLSATDEIEPLETRYWNLTSRINILSGTIENNRNSGISIKGVNNVSIYGVTINTDMWTTDGGELQKYHSVGCIAVEPLLFGTGFIPSFPRPVPTIPHTKRIEALNIDNVSFTGTAIETTLFIDWLVSRAFTIPRPPPEEDPPFSLDDDYYFRDAEGMRIPSNTNVVDSGCYHLLFAGNPNSHVHAPIGSTFSIYRKYSEENSNVRWEIGFGSPYFRLDPVVPPPQNSGLFQSPVTPQPQNLRLVETIYNINEIEKTEVVSMEELKATQFQKTEDLKGVSVEQLDQQKGAKIEILAPKTPSEILTLREQRMAVIKQLDRIDRIKIEFLSPKVIPDKR